ncbi:RHS repeat-associated core domain-containing protein, partial [Cronobacter sakazakii]
PLARVDSVFDDCEIYWYHTELNGLPERVTDADGQTVWRGQFSTWGETERELSVPQWQVPQNLRFQGQYLDRESGLHYNLFRYYDPVVGRYTQMDPIGLAGGMNTYSYVGDPLTWVDPLGLMSCGSDAVLLRQNMIREGIEEPSFKNSAHHIVMSNSTDARMVALRQKIEDFDLDINGSYNGVFLPTSSKVKVASGTSLPAHSKIHTNTYKQNVYERLINIDNAEEFVSELENISNMIMKNKFEF